MKIHVKETLSIHGGVTLYPSRSYQATEHDAKNVSVNVSKSVSVIVSKRKIVIERDMSAFIIKADGTEVQYLPKNKVFTLEEMRAAIGGGYVEQHTTRDNRYLFCDEDGKQKRLAPNLKASELMNISQIFVGDVLVCNRNLVR